MSEQVPHYEVVVIGSGFGGCMTALPLARKFAERGRGEKVLMLERGTWWTTPVNTVQDQEVKTYDHLVNNGQPVQFWSSLNHFRGFIDIFTRCFRRHKNEDGLFELTFLGRRGFLGLFGNQNDGVSVLRGNGVGGGSLVYSNITIRPPNVVLDDPRWPVKWKDENERNAYFDLARDCIGRGILWALNNRAKERGEAFLLAAGAPNTGLSNINTRVAGLNPHWVVVPDPLNARRDRKHINTPRTALDATSPGLPAADDKRDFKNDLWLARSRVFQTAVEKLTSDFGSVDLAINDYRYDPDAKKHGANQYDDKGTAKNFCDRQGRCNVGCLPGARHTLNKQLMAAMFGTPKHPEPDLPKGLLSIEPLSEVDVIVALPGGGYEVRYLRRDPRQTERTTRRSVRADRVIVAAGCLGTSEIMLRSKERGTLPNLSDKVGFGFSTNGDYLAFLEGTKESLSLVRGPVTTSYGHFNTGEAGTGGGDPATFHTIEDQGVPPALASTVGVGVPLIRSLANGRNKKLFILWAIILWAFRRLGHYWHALFANYRERQDIFRSDDETTSHMMCVVAMGRDASVGQFRLGRGGGDSPLRVRRTDGREFHEDPIYDVIKKSLDRLAEALSPAGRKGTFENPLLNPVSNTLKADSIAMSHPLGGCIMGADASQGVVDQYGRVFDATKDGARPFYEGLYVSDAAIIPTALGVNPSLTISTLALRIADKIVEELPP